MPVLNRIAELAPEIAEWRRDLHRHPEILFDTHRTSALVAEKLRAFGCDEVVDRHRPHRRRRRHQGPHDRLGQGRSACAPTWTRCRSTRRPACRYASTTPGAMHACGHDGHTAMLLGAAQYLAETRNFDGTAIVIFQPAEEGGGGGREMVEDGMMDRFGVAGGLRHAQHAGPARSATSRSAPAR